MQSKPRNPLDLPQPQGRLYEDFEVGARFPHWPGRTILEADNTWFTLLTMNTHPVHFDASYAHGETFGRPLVNSLLTLAIVTGMSVRDTSQRAVANLGWSEIRLVAPVFAGDTLYAESTVTGMRLSASRPGEGIVALHTTGFNERGTTVVEFDRSFLVPCRGGAAGSRAGSPAP